MVYPVLEGLYKIDGMGTNVEDGDSTNKHRNMDFYNAQYPLGNNM